MSKTAIVTGGGTGIGRAVALALCRDGYSVTVAGRRTDLLEETAKLRQQGDAPIIPIAADITKHPDVRHLFDCCVERFGHVDLLFNNAGTGTRPVEFDELDLEEWRRVVDVNLTGAFLCAREAFRCMRTQVPRGGRIINNGSISSHSPRPHSAPYTATKHAISGLTKSISLDGRKFDIACGQIDIGNAATEMTVRMAKGALQADGSVISEPTMDVEEAARAVVYMASLPLSTNVQFLTVMATKLPFVGRG